MAVKAQFDADFGKFIGELQKVEVKLRDFEPAADKASAKLQRMADSLNGNKILEQAAIAVNAIKRIEGGVGALNNGELKRYGTLIDAATEKLVRQGREVPPALAQVKSALDQARQSAEGVSKSVGDAGGALGGLGGAIAQGLGVGAGLGAFGLITGAVSGLKDSIVQTIAEGNKLSQLRTAFESLKGGAGPAAIAMGDLRSATRGLVSDIDLLAAANKASLLGLDAMGIKTDELASVAVRLGKAMGQDAAKSVDDLTTALARQSPMILDNLGIKVDLTSATEKYAASIGKSASALTDEEKKFAFATAAMAAAREKANTLGEAKLTLSEQIARVTNNLDNMQGGLGAAINESGLLSDVVGALAGRIEKLGENLSDVGAEFRDALGPLGDFVGRFARLPALSDDVADGFSLVVLPALGALNLALKGASEQLNRFATLREAVTGTLADVTLPSISRDRTLLDPTAGQNKRAQDYLVAEQKRLTDEYVKSQDDALRKLEQGEQKKEGIRDNARAEALRKEADHQKRLNDLTGRTSLIKAKQDVTDLASVGGVSALSPAQAGKLFEQLVDAREVAKAIAPNMVAGFSRALDQLATAPTVLANARAAGAKIFKSLLDPNDIRKVLATSGTSVLVGKSLAQAISPIPDALKPAIADTYALRKGLADVSVPLSVINERFDKVTKTSKDWRSSVQGVSQAFANLSQVAGGLSPVTRQIGLIVSSLDTAEQLVTSVGKAFNSKFDFGKSKAGQTAASGLAAGLAGFEIGTSAGLSPFRSAGVGAIGGAAAGLPAAAATGGASVAVGAIVGATTAYFGAKKAESELRKAKDLQAETLVAQYGTLDALLKTVGDLGLSQQSFLEKYYGEPKAFAKGVTDLNNALKREKNDADALAKSLQKVQDAQGVLSKGDRASLLNARKGGPVEDIAKTFQQQQTGSLLGGLQSILNAPGALSAALVKGVGQSLPAALAALEKGGASPIEALKTLMPLLDQFREKAVLAGAGSTPGFDALNAQLALLKDERLGPLIERASGAGQALGALSNLNLLDADTFSGFASSITESVAGLDLLSTQGQNAMRLIRGPLQNVWQLQKDFGFAVDEATQALLDQAGAAGLIGDKFRPAEEKLLLGIDRIVSRLDDLIDVFTDDLATDAGLGAEAAGKNILDAFALVRPRIQVGFEYDPRDMLPPTSGSAQPSGPAGAAAAQRATASSRGGDIYYDGERVGYHTLRHAGDFADLIGAS